MGETKDYSAETKHELAERYIKALQDPYPDEPYDIESMEAELFRRYQVNTPEDLRREIAMELGFESNEGSTETNHVFNAAEGYHHPFKTGWKLAQRSMVPTLKAASISGFIFALVYATGGYTFLEIDPVESNGFHEFLLFVVGGLGLAMVALTLTNQYHGNSGSVPVMTFKRLIPWVFTWVLVILATFVGYLMLIIPGYIVAIRLFWADEFAIGEGANPIEAVRKSWNLTQGYGWKIFGFQILAGLAAYVIVAPGFFLLLGASTLVETAMATINVPTLTNGVLAFYYFTGGMICYSFLHGPEIAYFYGLRALRDETSEGETTEADLSHLPGEI